jgi:hypothetical protein
MFKIALVFLMFVALMATAQNTFSGATDSHLSSPGELPNVDPQHPPLPTQQDGNQHLVTGNDIYAMLPSLSTELENTTTSNVTMHPTNASIPQPNTTTEVKSSSARIHPSHIMLLGFIAAFVGILL